jgi:hypothetical protein
MSLQIKRTKKRKPNDLPGIANYYTGTATIRLSNFINELVTAMDELSDADLDKVHDIIIDAERVLNNENVTDNQVDLIINRSINALSDVEEPTINVLRPKIAADTSNATNLQELPILKKQIMDPSTPLINIDPISGKPDVIFDAPPVNSSIPAQHIVRVPSIYDGVSNGIRDPRNISNRNVTTPHSDINIGDRITDEYTGDPKGSFARELATIDQINSLRNPYHDAQNTWYEKFKHYAPSAATTLGVLGLAYLQNGDPGRRIQTFFPNGVHNLRDAERAIQHNNPLFDPIGFKDNPLYGREKAPIKSIRDVYLPQYLTDQNVNVFDTPSGDRYKVNVISNSN